MWATEAYIARNCTFGIRQSIDYLKYQEVSKHAKKANYDRTNNVHPAIYVCRATQRKQNNVDTSLVLQLASFKSCSTTN